jgi:hypothetical protein
MSDVTIRARAGAAMPKRHLVWTTAGNAAESSTTLGYHGNREIFHTESYSVFVRTSLAGLVWFSPKIKKFSRFSVTSNLAAHA